MQLQMSVGVVSPKPWRQGGVQCSSLANVTDDIMGQRENICVNA